MAQPIKALLLHTDAHQRKILAGAAVELGFDVLEGTTLDEALPAPPVAAPQVAVLEMSDVSGRLLQQIRCLPGGEKTVVLLVAGRRPLADPQATLTSSGADDLLPAPVTERAARVRLTAAARLAGERQTEQGANVAADAADSMGEVRRLGQDGIVARLLARFRRPAERPRQELPDDAPAQTRPGASDSPAEGGVASRLELLQRLEGAFSNPRAQPHGRIALILVDLDRFKQVNFDLGHAAGDELLAAVAERLTHCLRNSDPLLRPEHLPARMGGDEFALVLEGLRERRDAARVADRLLEDLRRPFTIRGREVFLTASLGIYWGSTASATAEEFFRAAEKAMYRAKEQGRAGYVLFDEADRTDDGKPGALALEASLRRAVENRLFEIRLQPIVSLFDGRLAGFEALSRRRGDNGEILMPRDFVPLAEETGLIAEVDRLALHEACRQLRAWSVRFRHEPLVPIAVNISGRHLTRPDLLSEIDRTLRLHGLDGRLLKLEITESTFMDGIRFADELFRQLHRMGISLSLDDFGTGYSSMSTLRRFAIDTLKVDAGFVARMLEDEDSREIVRAIVHLARNLGKDAVAEGVETHSQLEMLRIMGCQLGQGFLMAPPLELDAATALLAGHLQGEPVVPNLTPPLRR